MKKRVKSDERNTENHRFLKPRIRPLLALLCVIMIVISVNAVSVASSDLMVNESMGNDSNSTKKGLNNTIIDPRENETAIETENSTQTINNDSSSVIYVNGASGDDANDGATPDKAKKTIKNATDTVTAGGTIHIANGNYAGEKNRDITITKNVNIIGDSQSGTVINAEGSSRIFTVNNGVTVNIHSLTLTNGWTADGGGAIMNWGSLTVSGSTFTGNNANRGGTIHNGGSMSVSGSTFTGNTASGAGGAIYNWGYGHGSNLDVKSSTFTGNTAYQGGAISNEDGSTCTATGSTFTGNTANIRGSAIFNYYGTSEVHYNRIVGNTAPNGHDIDSVSGSVNAVNNWWGSNDNPSSRVGGDVNVGPWLVLSVKADPTNIPVGSNSIVTVDLLRNSNNESVSGPVPEGIPVTFNVTNGTISPESSILVNGSAKSTFTSNNPGTASVISTVDDQTILTPITVRTMGSMIYVNDAYGDDFNDGSTPDKAKKTIKNAVNNVDADGTIYIANGNYAGENNRDITISKSMNIIGESQSGTVVDAQGSSGTIFSLRLSEYNAVTIQNLTLTNAYGAVISIQSNVGGSLTVNSCTFTNNYGVIKNAQGTLTVVDSTFIGNTAGANDGGAIYSYGSLNVSGCTFTGNNASMGGAILNSYGPLTVSGSTFENNTASRRGGAIANSGSNSVTVTDSTFMGNTVSSEYSGYGSGGAIDNMGSGNSVTVNGSTFIGNTVSSRYYEYGGGAIHSSGGDSSSLSVSDSTFIKNTASNHGGAILKYYGSLNVSSSTFTENTAGYGGAIRHDSNLNGIFEVHYSSFTENTAVLGGAISNGGGNSEVHYNYFIGNTASMGKDIYAPTASVNAANNWWGSNDNPSSGVSGNVNVGPWLVLTITADPTSIPARGNSTVTADLLHNSNNESVSDTVPDGIPVKFGATNGNISPKLSTLVKGKATSVFTAGASGTAHVTATVDMQTVSTQITINKISTQLTVNNVSGVYGETVNLTATLTDSNNHPLKDKTLTFSIGSSNYNATTNEDGIVTVSHKITQAAGVHDVTAAFAGDEYYNQVNGTGSLSVSKALTGTVVDGVSGYAGQNVTLTAYMKDQGNNPVTEGQVKFIVNGTVLDPVDVIDGVATFNWVIPSTWSAGDYSIVADYLGTGNYDASSGNNTLTVNKTSTKLTVNNVTGVYGENVNLIATLTDGNSHPLKDKTVTFSVGGSSYNATTDEDGVAIVSHKITQTAGVHNITVAFAGDNYHNPVNGTGNLTVNKATTGLIVTDVSGVYDENVDLTATLTDGSGKPLVEKTVTFSVDGSNYNATTGENGVAVVSHKITQAAGSYPISVVFAGDGYYNPVNGTGNLTVGKALTGTVVDGVSGYAGQNVTLTAHVKDQNDNPVNGGQVKFIVNGTALDPVNVSNGTAKVNWVIPFTWGVGEYSMVADYLGTDNYDASSGNNTLTVTKMPTQLTVNNVSGVYGENVDLTATLIDGSGKPLKDKTVTFSVGDSSYNATTGEDGIVTVSHKIVQTAGVHDVTAVFAGDEYYSPVNGTGSLTVDKAVAGLVVADVSGVYGENVNLTATLTDKGSPLANKHVTFSVGGSSYNATTGEDGVAVVSHKITQSIGDHPISVVFAGDEYYNQVKGTGSLSVSKALTGTVVDGVSGYAGENVTLTAHMKDQGNNPVTEGQVKFIVNGTALDPVDVSNGTAKVNWVIPSTWGIGDYSIVADYLGTDNYDASSGNNTLTVTKVPTQLTVNNVTGAYGETVDLTATLIDGSGKPLVEKTVTFSVGDSSYNATTGENGVATISHKITQTAGVHDVTAVFAGDNDYGSATGAGNLTVDRAAAGLVVANVTGIHGETVNLTATLTDSNDHPLKDKAVTFSVGDSSYNATTDEDGVAVVSHKITQAGGVHDVTAVFAGDGYYNPVNGTGNLTVGKALTGTVVDGVSGYAGQNVTLTAYMKDQGNNPVTEGQVKFIVNGTVLDPVDVIDGVATFNWVIPSTWGIGDYSIVADYLGTDNYDASSGNNTLTVTKVPTQLRVAHVAGIKGQTVDLTAILIDGTGKPLVEKTVTFSVGGSSYNATTGENGVVTVAYKISENAGSYPINVTFAGDEYYSPVNGTGNLVVNKIGTNLAVANVTGVYGETVNLTAALTDDNSHPLKDKTVTFSIGNSSYNATTDEDGIVVIPHKITQAAGVHDVTAVFAGDGYYNPVNGTGSLTVDRAVAGLVVANVTGTYGEAVNLTATLTDKGSPLADKHVTFSVGGSSYNATTGEDGVAVVSHKITQSIGDHPISVVFAGDDYYNPVNGTGGLSVSKALTGTVVDGVSGYAGQNVTLTAHVKDQNDNPVTEGQVKFIVNGTALDPVDVSDGTAKVNWVIPSTWSVGEYSMVADYLGTGNYDASSGNSTLTVTKVPTQLMVDNVGGVYGENVDLTVVLIDGNSHPLKDKTVTFSIGGSSYNATTGEKGVATVSYKITQAAGVHDLTVVFAGDDYYGPVNGTGSLTVDRAVAGLVVANVTGAYGETVNLTATLTDKGSPLVNKIVTFSVGGSNYNATTNGEGIVVIPHKITQTMGVHDVTAAFAGDDYYNPVNGTGGLSVSKALTGTVVDGVSGYAGQNVTLTAHVKDQSNNPVIEGQVKFIVNGTVLDPVDVIDGVATFNWVIPSTWGVGEYSIVADYLGTGNYDVSSGNNTLTVTKTSTQLRVNNATGVNNATVDLTATLTDGNGKPLVEKPVTFSIGDSKYSATTDGSGVATVAYKISENAGSYPVNVAFAGDDEYLDSEGSGVLRVNPSAGLYLKPTVSNNNPKVGESFVITYKLGNRGPDAAENVKITFKVPEGLEYGGVDVDSGSCNYNPVTRVVTWTLDSVPVGDPYLYLTVKALKSGKYTIISKITSTTYNWNSGDDTSININVQSSSGGSSGGSGSGKWYYAPKVYSGSLISPSIPQVDSPLVDGFEGAVEAVSDVIPPQKEGFPLNYLLLAILATLVVTGVWLALRRRTT